MIKAGLPFESFRHIEEYLNVTNFQPSEQVQILDTGAAQVIKSITAQVSEMSRDIMGGDAIAKLSAALVQLNAGQTPDLAQIERDWQPNYPTINCVSSTTK